MSRKPDFTSSTYSTMGTAPSAGAIMPDQFCPVCKRGKYLHPEMKFLINPECYHSMCNSCVENIFRSGPAQCPYAACTKTLRQRGFRPAFFEDLAVEREVDIRRRVAAVFNMARDDFESLRDYNNYLQEVEDLTFDLVSGADAARSAAEDRLRAHEQAHKEKIEANRRRGREADAQRLRRQEAENDAARRRRQEEREAEERARAEEAKVRDEVMEALARGEPGASAADIQKRILARKKTQVARIAGSQFPSALGNNDTAVSAPSSGASTPLPTTGASSGGSNLLSIRGLRDKAKIAAEEEEDLARPYDPFGGVDLTPTRYVVRGGGRAAAGYANPHLDKARSSDSHRVGGYDTGEYVARALFEAFAGLGIDLAQEKEERKPRKGNSKNDINSNTPEVAAGS